MSEPRIAQILPSGSPHTALDYSKFTTVYGCFPSLRQIRAFAAAAQLQSILKASINLNVSQSAVTQAIAKLEADLDTILFERRNKGSYLTDIGKILQEHTEQFLDHLEDALRGFMRKPASCDGASLEALVRRITKSQIIALIAIREAGSFTQAARYAGVSQPSIHRSARSLEAQLKTELFYDTAHGSMVNDRGADLADRLHLAIREFEWAYEKIEAEKRQVRGRILVGGLLLAGSGFLASAISQFATSYPDVNVDVACGSYDVLLEKLRAGSLDFIVGLLKSPPPADDVVEEVLVADPYVIAIRKDHPLAGKEKITHEKLAEYDWVLPGPTAARRSSFERIFAGSNSIPRANVETHSLTTILLLLVDSDRMTILTESQLILDRKLGHNLTSLNYQLTQPPGLIGVTTRKNWTPTHNQKIFLNFLRQTKIDNILQKFRSDN
jgi:LysR family transcriptional regulator of gallate degradation